MSRNIQSYEAESSQLLNDLQALDSALVQITLYLDSHPYDENAIVRHNELAEQRHITRDKLEETRTLEADESQGWRWSLSPWPWRV
jgi:spore coat protein JB